MSRSYRKYPLFRCTLWSGSHNRSMKAGKRYHNRKIRRYLKQHPEVVLGKGRSFKFLGIDSYDLYEYKHYKTMQDAINEWDEDQKEIEYGIKSWKARYNQSFTEMLNDWKSSYIRK